MSLLRAHWRTPALLAVAALAVTAPSWGQLPSADAAPGDVAFASSFEANQSPPTLDSTPKDTKISGRTDPDQTGIFDNNTGANPCCTASADDPPDEATPNADDGDENNKLQA